MEHQTKKQVRLVKPEESEREAISEMIDRALDSDYAMLVKLK